MGQGLHRPLASLNISLDREIPDWEEQSCAGEPKAPCGPPSCSGADLCTPTLPLSTRWHNSPCRAWTWQC